MDLKSHGTMNPATQVSRPFLQRPPEIRRNGENNNNILSESEPIPARARRNSFWYENKNLERREHEDFAGTGRANDRCIPNFGLRENDLARTRPFGKAICGVKILHGLSIFYDYFRFDKIVRRLYAMCKRFTNGTVIVRTWSDRNYY